MALLRPTPLVVLLLNPVLLVLLAGCVGWVWWVGR